MMRNVRTRFVDMLRTQVIRPKSMWEFARKGAPEMRISAQIKKEVAKSSVLSGRVEKD